MEKKITESGLKIVVKQYNLATKYKKITIKIFCAAVFIVT